jgi:hypothetical protein
VFVTRIIVPNGSETMRRGHGFGIKRLAARRLSALARVNRRDAGFVLPLLRSSYAAGQANEKKGRHSEADKCRVSLEEFH